MKRIRGGRLPENDKIESKGKRKKGYGMDEVMGEERNVEKRKRYQE